MAFRLSDFLRRRHQRRLRRGPHVLVDGNTVPLTVTKPRGTPPDRGFPVAIVSHGLMARPAQYRRLFDGLRTAGFVTVAPDHQEHVLRNVWRPNEDRPKEIQQIIRWLGTEEPGFPVRGISLIGHSWGGRTALEVNNLQVEAKVLIDPMASPIGLPAQHRVLVLSSGDPFYSVPALPIYSEARPQKFFAELDEATHFDLPLSPVAISLMVDFLQCFMEVDLEACGRIGTRPGVTRYEEER